MVVIGQDEITDIVPHSEINVIEDNEIDMDVTQDLTNENDAVNLVDVYVMDPKFVPTPKGHKYWVPNVPVNEKPKIDIVFNNFNDAYVLCNKAGKPRKTVETNTLIEDGNDDGKEDHNEDGKIKRKCRWSSTLTDCKARIGLKRIVGQIHISTQAKSSLLDGFDKVRRMPIDWNNFKRDQCAGSDTRPPMLDRTDFASWQQRIRLYCRGKENGVNILKSIDEGPYQIGTVQEPLAEGTKGAPQFGPERPRIYADLSPEEKDRYNADIRAINILLQGLPKDIYTLINHYTDAKDIWDNVKMLLEGSELTKEDRESQLYDDFEHFRQHKGEMHLNSKFVNNMLPEWGRFVTAVKLNRGLRDSNYDQLYVYLKQHETHAMENKMMLGRQNKGQGMNPRGRGAAGYGGAHNRVANVNPGQARPVKRYNYNGAGHIARNCTQPK
nr:FAR1 DNA binding domain-containing protein [Tanacetum cinerariifolium]